MRKEKKRKGKVNKALVARIKILNKKMVEAHNLIGDLVLLFIGKKDIPGIALRKFVRFNKQLREINKEYTELISETIFSFSS